jgi:hypothetical protein
LTSGAACGCVSDLGVSEYAGRFRKGICSQNPVRMCRWTEDFKLVELETSSLMLNLRARLVVSLFVQSFRPYLLLEHDAVY